MERLGINLGYLLVQIANFLILFIVMRVWVFQPIVRMLDKRRETIDKGLEDARIAAEARANAEKEAQALLAKAQGEANLQVRQAVERAETSAREIRARAEKEIADLRASAAQEAEQAKLQALAEVRGQIGALAVAAAQKLIGENLDEKRQRALVDEFFSGLKGGKVVLLEGEKLAGAHAEVTSALPLSAAETEALRKELVSRLGEGAEVTFRVDPEILGGVVIRAGDRILDGSVAGRLESMRTTLH
ncbi:MAG: F0F1 ATP synthase subunit B [Anaerolineales bacterium]